MDVTHTVACLACKLFDFDSDGLDFEFMVGDRKIRNEKNIETILDALKREAPHPHDGQEVAPDVATDLNRVFMRYRDRLEKHSRLHRPVDQHKDMTVLLVTNGLWTGNGSQEEKVEREIIKIIDYLIKVSKTTILSSFSIEFVAFGNDDRAIKAFKHWDDDLQTEDRKLQVTHEFRMAQYMANSSNPVTSLTGSHGTGDFTNLFLVATLICLIGCHHRHLAA